MTALSLRADTSMQTLIQKKSAPENSSNKSKSDKLNLISLREPTGRASQFTVNLMSLENKQLNSRTGMGTSDLPSLFIPTSTN